MRSVAALSVDATQDATRLSSLLDSFLLSVDALCVEDAKEKDAKLEKMKNNVMRMKAIVESMSGDDWSKMGVALALLWYKFDRMIDELKGIRDDTKSISGNTRK
jgi:hypothetical protein